MDSLRNLDKKNTFLKMRFHIYLIFGVCRLSLNYVINVIINIKKTGKNNNTLL